MYPSEQECICLMTLRSKQRFLPARIWFKPGHSSVVHHIPKANMETQRSPQPMGSGRWCSGIFIFWIEVSFSGMYSWTTDIYTIYIYIYIYVYIYIHRYTYCKTLWLCGKSSYQRWRLDSRHVESWRNMWSRAGTGPRRPFGLSDNSGTPSLIQTSSWGKQLRRRRHRTWKKNP